MKTRVCLGHSLFHGESVALVLNTRTSNVSPDFHAVFDDTFFIVDHMRKGKVPRNWKNLVEGYSDLTTQEYFSLSK